MGERVVEWYPTQLVRRTRQENAVGFALIVLNQPIDEHLGVVKTLWGNASIRVAADGGANILYEAAGQKEDDSLDNLQVIIGDLDSLNPTTREYYKSKGTTIIHEPDQDSNDFGKAISYVRAVHPGINIVAVGGLGGRVDQGLSQLHHLYLFQKGDDYKEGRIFLFSGESLTFLLKRGVEHRIRVKDEGEKEKVFGKHVGILPLGGRCKITTEGLEWDVEDWETEFGGMVSTSNHLLEETEVVKVWAEGGDVLFTVALRKWEGVQF
ncbi:thiamine pyrophosphokinase [Podospora fimiseda]|uniref:Thiamine pyrophosphokinase n=1 Tax=Podospora fimiseda TaxID=252190 RepID=A0AAN7H3B9_9PEZI|nr:thiamine pyrophosphokinase [Podospora fimiseda]